jgi:hypothetical protein
MQGRNEKCNLSFENLKGRDSLEDLGIGGRITSD